MLIITEENKELKGTTYKLPKKVYDIFNNVVLKYGEYASYPGYVRAKNVFSGNGYVTMEWLKNMKQYFSKHPKGIEFVLGGGEYVKQYVETKLRLLTANTNTKRAEHTNDTTKPYQGGNTHKAKTSNLSKELGLIENRNVYIITEEQLKKLKKHKDVSTL